MLSGKEPCDWCARPGRPLTHDIWNGRSLVCRDPALCDVCALLWSAPRDAAHAFIEAGFDYDRSMRAVEAELERKWREKVERGLRAPADDQEQPPPYLFEEWRQRRPVGRRQLWMRSEIGAESPFWDHNGHMVSLESLPLPALLRQSLERWTATAWESEDGDVRAEGLRLLEEVVGQLRATFRVVWDDD